MWQFYHTKTSTFRHVSGLWKGQCMSSHQLMMAGWLLRTVPTWPSKTPVVQPTFEEIQTEWFIFTIIYLCDPVYLTISYVVSHGFTWFHMVSNCILQYMHGNLFWAWKYTYSRHITNINKHKHDLSLLSRDPYQCPISVLVPPTQRRSHRTLPAESGCVILLKQFSGRKPTVSNSPVINMSSKFWRSFCRAGVNHFPHFYSFLILFGDLHQPQPHLARNTPEIVAGAHHGVGDASLGHKNSMEKNGDLITVFLAFWKLLWQAP